ncbi:PREDICTED: mitogen-activated protein kinase kinase kinase NPK1-like [Nelumbo nucifera]|uniref:Mitogen-activated protein kinase kinase kinase NPK1-like n=1 Tax=Nelumbo nucifera TaxID=4432 RepID=A0A1U8B2T9_NELNU|nr:PREDICTED: mitogen-activated protein kinase kinase kinase NPK1-like [Nelumbo nucifera]
MEKATWIRGKTIGRGSYSVVSLAETNHHLLPPVIAVKSSDYSMSGSIQEERKILTQLQDCPQVIHCYGDDVTVEDGFIIYNLWLEYASGGSLHDRIVRSGGGLPESEVRRYTRSILRGLSHIHKCGFVHCDLKPENLLLVPSSSSKGRSSVKIADLGLSKRVGEDMLCREDGMLLRTTPLYAAPESIKCCLYEPCSDIWSLGCTVIMMITGKPAWDFPPEADVDLFLNKIGNNPVVPEIPEKLSIEGKDFLNLCLIRDETLRWTADMLLLHPFVSVDDENDEGGEETKGAQVETGKFEFVQSPRQVFDFPPCGEKTRICAELPGF